MWRDFAPQLEKRLHSSELFFKGINRIMVGFAKKAIIADTLGATVLKITYNLNFGIDSPTALFGALCYFFQIYYDFSGYSDIAIGISNIFGFNLFENFNHPYISKFKQQKCCFFLCGKYNLEIVLKLLLKVIILGFINCIIKED